MKVIRPIVINNQNMTSNIPEPDPASGEAVYAESDKTLKPISGANNLKSLAFLSGFGYAVSTDKSWKNKAVNKYNENLSLTSSASIATGQFQDMPQSFGNTTDSDANGNVVLVCAENTGGFIYRSVDSGKTFTAVNVGIAGGFTPYTAVITPSGDCFCAYKHIIMKSVNDGNTWSVVSNTNEAEFSYGNSRLAYNGSRVMLQGRESVKVSNTGLSSFTYYSNVANQFYGYTATLTGEVYSFRSSTEIIKSTDNGVNFTSSVTIDFQPAKLFASSGSVWVTQYNSAVFVRYNLNLGGKTTLSHGLGTTTVFDVVEIDGAIIMLGANGKVSISTDGSNFRVIDELAGNNAHMCASSDYAFMCGRNGTNSRRILKGIHSICNTTNQTDNTSINTISFTNAQVAGKEMIQFTKYGDLLSSPILNGSVDVATSAFSNPTYGQACADGRYIYQLIKDGNWFVYKMDTTLGASTKLDLGTQNSGYINNLNANPYIFLVGETLNVPINKAAATGIFDAVLRLDKTPATTVEVVPNQLLDSKSLGAVYNTENVYWFLDNDKVELTDAVNFDQLGGYREGDEIISLSTHRRYRATTNTLDTPEAGSLKVPPTWTDIAPTNKYSAFSTYIHNRTESQSDIFFEFQGINSDSIALFGMVNAESLELRGYNSSGDVIYTNDLILLDSESVDVFGEIRLLDSIVITGIDSDVVRISVKLIKGDEQSTVAVGRIVVGKALEIGVSQYGASLSIEDFSRRERDEFGNFTVSQRSTAKNINFDVKIDKQKVNAVFRLLSELTTIPCVWLGDDNDAALQVYGFYSDYTHNIDYPSITSATISVEGLT